MIFDTSLEEKTEIELDVSVQTELDIDSEEFLDVEVESEITKYIDISIDDTNDLSIELDTGLTGDPYPGPYIVTPKKDIEQKLETNGLYMADDVTVLEVPYSEVSNTAGGTTCNIAYIL